MSSNWTRTTIGSACRVGDGAHGSLKRYDNGIMYLTSKNFKADGLDLSKVDYIDEKTYQKYFRESSNALTKPGAGDVLFSIIGSIGSPYLVQANGRFGISSSVAILRPNTSLVLPEYLFDWIKGQIYQDALYGVKGGVAQSYISLEMIRSLPLHYPPLPIQRKIAGVLSAYDDLIEVNTRRIHILEQMAGSVYREWFGKVDEKSLPEGWEITKLSEIADVNSSNIKRGNEPEEINYVDIASVSTGKIDLIQPMKFVEAPGRARRIVEHGDVIWSTVRPNRKSYSLIINPSENLIVSTGFAVLRAKSVPFSYLYLATTTEEFAGYLTNHATGSAYPAVNSADFENAEILLPPKALLHRFDELATPMYLMQETLLAKNANLRRTRDLLLPRLVSGEVAVHE